jgi:NAD dependent epimerase/dehydratase family enzyme
MTAILFVCEHPQVSGPLNFCAPNPVRNRKLASALGEVLGRPAIVPAPAFVIRAVLGEFGNVLLDGQRAIPAKLLSHGFEFQYPDIRAAIREVIS